MQCDIKLLKSQRNRATWQRLPSGFPQGLFSSFITLWFHHVWISKTWSVGRGLYENQVLALLRIKLTRGGRQCKFTVSFFISVLFSKNSLLFRLDKATITALIYIVWVPTNLPPADVQYPNNVNFKLQPCLNMSKMKLQDWNNVVRDFSEKKKHMCIHTHTHIHML